MLTAGIDLAAQAANTGAALIAWEADGAELLDLAVGVDDEACCSLVQRAARTGIDAPFGWPDAFVAAVAAHHSHGAWPEDSRLDPGAFRRGLRLRLTDAIVAAERGLRPLSVSSDLIAVPAMRCAQLLQRLAAEGMAIDRSGVDPPVCEAYPAGALHAWGLPRSGYKGTKGREIRAAIVGRLLEQLPRLRVGDADRSLLARSDHTLDALLAALLARAAALGQTRPPTPPEREVAQREGWIHVPRAGHSVGDLFVDR